MYSIIIIFIIVNKHAFILGALRVATGQFRTQLVVSWSPTETSSLSEAQRLGTDPYFHRALPLEERLTNWINPAAFTAAPAYTFGNAPRTLPDLRTPGQRNVDLSIQKTQTFAKSKTIAVRADVLNLFDNPLFTTLVTQYGTSAFGQLTAVGGYARSVQFQIRVGF